jgi:oligoribonuclease NrnB/cAMP/cGMP phosphodiesterase (DHH superfamily)
MKECGATLTWKTLFPNEPMPALLEYVKDRDLWNFDLPGTEEIHETISFMGRKLYQLDFLATLSQEELIRMLSPIGERLLYSKRRQVAELAESATSVTIKNQSAMMAIIPEIHSRLTSDICAAMYKSHPDADFVVSINWNTKEQYWGLSFRSDKNGNNFDVSTIAKQFNNGGGHRNAAGAYIFELSELFE